MKILLIVLSLLLILGGLIGWAFMRKQAEGGGQGGPRMGRMNMPVSVEMATPQRRDIINTFEATGSVEAIQDVNITPKSSGIIENLKVREGDHIKQGQVLVRIDQSAATAEVHQQQAALAQAQSRLAQAKISQSTTDISVTTQIKQQQAALASAQADLTESIKTREAQLEATKSTIIDAQSKIDNAKASVNNANASIRSAQANLDNATAKFNRITELFNQKYVAAQDVDDAKTAVSVQQSALDIARGQLQAANAAVDSATAQKHTAEQQVNIVRATADANVEAARAKVAQARASLEYARANATQTPAYKENLSALSAAVDVAKASLQSSLAKLADTVLRSPLDGVVTARNQDVGGLASPNQPILTVQAMNKVWVTIAVPDDVCAKIHLNQPTNVAFDALKGRSFPARIAQINPSADPQSRQYTVRVILDNKENLFTGGMFARVTLVTDKVSQALAVPLEAVKLDKDGTSYIMAAGADDTAVRIPVVTGASDANWIAITSGLDQKMKVVTMSASQLREGQKISAGRKGGRGPGGRGNRDGGPPPTSPGAGTPPATRTPHAPGQ